LEVYGNPTCRLAGIDILAKNKISDKNDLSDSLRDFLSPNRMIT